MHRAIHALAFAVLLPASTTVERSSHASDFFRGPAFYVTGKIVRADRKALTGAAVEAAGETVRGERVSFGRQTTDRQGCFKIAVPTPGVDEGAALKLVVTLSVRPTDGDSCTATREVADMKGDIDFGVVVWTPPRLIRFRVLDPAGEPVDWASLTVEPEAPSTTPTVSSLRSAKAETDSEGRASIECGGQLRVTVEKRDFDLATVSFDTTTKAAGEEVVIRLAPPAIFEAAILVASDLVEGLSVQIECEGRHLAGPYARTTAVIEDGVARFEGLYSGIGFTAVVLDAIGEVPETRLKVAALEAAESRKARLPVPPNACRLVGRVVDSTGQAATGAAVIVRPYSDDPLITFAAAMTGLRYAALTDADGKFECALLGRDAVRVSIGTKTGSLERVVNLAGPRVEETFKLEPLRRLACVVRDKEGRAVSADGWKLTGSDGGALISKQVFDDNGAKLPKNESMFVVVERPVHAEVVVAGRTLTGDAGPRDGRLEIAAPDFGCVRLVMPRAARDAAALHPCTFKTIPEGGEPVATKFGGCFAIIAFMDPLEIPLYAGKWRLTWTSPSGATTLALDVVVEAGKTIDIDLAAPR